MIQAAGTMIKLFLRRTLVHSDRKSASPEVRKKFTLSDSLSDFADLYSTVQVSDTTGDAISTTVKSLKKIPRY